MEYEVDAMIKSDLSIASNTLYSSAKLAADYMAKAVCESQEISYIRAVISNIYGPGESSPRLINSSIRKMLNGEHCAFSPGKQMYDFIYITDAGMALAAIGQKGKKGKTYYIGSQNPRPLREFLIEMKNQVDPKIEIGLGEIPYGGVMLSYKEFDVESVAKDTGFTPRIGFEEGIRNTIAWIKEVG
jgi:nucleoside-diphosphate-sugar epimerase